MRSSLPTFYRDGLAQARSRRLRVHAHVLFLSSNYVVTRIGERKQVNERKLQKPSPTSVPTVPS